MTAKAYVQEELAIEIAEAVIKALKGDLPSTVVNEPMVAAEVYHLVSLRANTMR